jgi:hypothetical protein
MLGMMDFVRAARNSARLALRRVHPLAGPVLIGVIWTLALGSVLWITREDDGGRSMGDDAASYTERDGAGTRSVDRDGGDGSGDDGTGDGGVGQVEWTDGAEGSAGDGDGDDGGGSGDTASGDAGDQDGTGRDPTLESPGGPGSVTPPSSTGSPPSWLPEEPEEPGPGGPGSTTTSTTSPSTTGPTTSTTVPAAGGLLDVLLGVLFP